MLIGTVEATLLVLLLVIVFGPIIAERFRIPGIIGLIAGGVIVDHSSSAGSATRVLL